MNMRVGGSGSASAHAPLMHTRTLAIPAVALHHMPPSSQRILRQAYGMHDFANALPSMTRDPCTRLIAAHRAVAATCTT